MTGRKHDINPNFVYLAAACLVFLTACGLGSIYDRMERVPGQQWAVKQEVTFNFNIPDTTAMYDLYLQVRHTTDYPFSNLFIFMNTTTPEGAVGRDTLECILAAPDGRWLGRGLGSMRESRILFRKAWRFSAIGPYQITLQHAMRAEVLEGIADIGLRIEKE